MQQIQSLEDLSILTSSCLAVSAAKKQLSAANERKVRELLKQIITLSGVNAQEQQALQNVYVQFKVLVKPETNS